MIGVDFYHWPWPIGYLAQAVWPNILAAVLCAVGFWQSFLKQHFKKIHLHNEWVAKETAKQSAKLNLTTEPHPTHGDLNQAADHAP